jgi:hypothetical protein
MKWTAESKEAERARKNAARRPQWERECSWHRWFAWYPVQTSPTNITWMGWVERRLGYSDRTTQPQWYNWDIRHFEYRHRQRW